MGAFLANFLQNADDALEITDVERGKNEPHMSEMTVTVFKVVSACCASVGLIRDTHTLVERSMCNHCSGLVQVEELSIGNFHYSLADNIIVGSVDTSIH
jgi:hypothetical protein